jgi:hypothetical protein
VVATGFGFDRAGCACKEFDLNDAAAVRARFLRVDDELQLRCHLAREAPSAGI